MNITLKNVPEPVYRAIKGEAKRNKRSLNSEIVQVLESKAVDVARRRRIKKWRAELDAFVATLPPMPDCTPIIRRERERR